MATNGHTARDQSPLWGAILCWTAIPPEERSEMAAAAQEMGACHKLDLTSDVTHLIVGNIDTPKYKYVAKERLDIKVLQPAWLHAVRNVWLEGEEVDVVRLEEQYRLPTFSGLQICVTGFEDFNERNGLQNAISDNGGTYHGDLTKAVTHLVAAVPSGKKYEYARLWNIKVVSIEWMQDSLRRGLVLDESLYHPDMPVSDRGLGAVTQRRVSSPVLGKRPRANEKSQEALDVSRRKLRRTASTRLESQNDDLWADIGSGDRPDPTNVLSHEIVEDAATSKRPSSGNRAGVVPSAPVAQNVAAPFLQTPDQHNRPFCIYGFDERKASVLGDHLGPNGGRIVAYSDLGSDSVRDGVMIIAPHDADFQLRDTFEREAGVCEDDVWVTEVWFEKCLHSKAFVSPDTHPLYKPFSKPSTSDFAELTICPTSFSGVDLLHFSKAVKLIGAKYDETLRRQTTVLVCNEAAPLNPEKLKYAFEYRISLVSQAWLWDCIRCSTLLPFQDYTISGSRQSNTLTQPAFFHPQINPRPRIKEMSSSKTFKGRPQSSKSQRQGQLDLSIESNLAPSRRGPFIDDDEETFNNEPQPSPRALQEIPPARTNSPRKKSSQALSKDLSQAPVEVSSLHHGDSEQNADFMQPLAEANEANEAPTPLNNPKQPQDSEEAPFSLNSAIASLLAHQQKASEAATSIRPSTASSDHKPTPLTSGHRRHRPLGRAPSYGSAGLTMSRNNSTGIYAAQSFSATTDDQTCAGAVEGVDNDELDPPPVHRKETDAFTSKFEPSQALSYEDPEGAAVRERLMRRGRGGERKDMGADGTCDNDGDRARSMKRVEGIGRVTDSRVGLLEDKSRRRGMRKRKEEAL